MASAGLLEAQSALIALRRTLVGACFGRVNPVNRQEFLDLSARCANLSAVIRALGQFVRRVSALVGRLGIAAVAGLLLQAVVQTNVLQPSGGAGRVVAAAIDRNAVDKRASAKRTNDATWLRSFARGGQDRQTASDPPDLATVLGNTATAAAIVLAESERAGIVPHLPRQRPQARAPPAIA